MDPQPDFERTRDALTVEQLPPAHRAAPKGSFDATLVTFAAMVLFEAMDDRQRARSLRQFDGAERRHWNFLPESGRIGLPLKCLTHEQMVLAHRLIAQSLSAEAYARVVQVISLEHVLRELNAQNFGHVAMAFRDPGQYFLTFFNQPQPDTDWGWRLLGHHLSLNITIVGQDLMAVTPFLLGSEPGKFGPFRILGDEEDAAFALLHKLGSAQLKQAIIHDKPPADLVTRTVETIGDTEIPGYHGVGRRDAAIADVDRIALAYFRARPRGLPVSDLGPEQRSAFDQLLGRFIGRVRPDQSAREMDRIAAAGGVESLHFAWAGGSTPELPHYFRIQGPATLIEFVNSEDNANHVHSVWRDPTNDFGDDVLLQHRPSDQRHGTHYADRAD